MNFGGVVAGKHGFCGAVAQMYLCSGKVNKCVSLADFLLSNLSA